MKHIFIVNPISGKGNGEGYIPVIERYFEQNPGDYEIIKTEYPKHATVIAKNYTAEDDVVLYSVGGDGTMKEILDGIDEKVALCVIPGGTGNDFYKTINMKQYTKEEIIKASVEGEEKYIDYGVFNGTSKFCNVISFGLDAAINLYACEVVKVEKPAMGDKTYAYATLKVGLHPEKYHMKLEVDGKHYEDDTILFSVGNGTYYGGTFNAFPFAKIDDGLFDCSYFKPMGFMQLLPTIMKYMKGTHLKSKKCVAFQGKHIHAVFDRMIPVQVDGENSRVQVVDIIMKAGQQKFRLPKF